MLHHPKHHLIILKKIWNLKLFFLKKKKHLNINLFKKTQNVYTKLDVKYDILQKEKHI